MPTVGQISFGADTSQLERDIQRAQNKINSRKLQIKIDDKASSALGNITGKTTTFNKALDAATARVVAFGAAAGAFNLVRKGVEELLRATIDVEQSLARININLNESQEGLKQFSKNIFDIARNTGQTFETAAKAAEELTRQGLTATETTTRLRDALILSRLAAIDSNEAVNALTASINSFSKEALSSTEILNKLAAVDAKFAVSTNDLAQAVSRVGSSASEAGVQFDELLGIVTAVQQTTARGGAVIGNALKTIFTRIERPQTLNDLEALGVGVRDIQGQTLPAVQILKNLATSYDTLSQSQRSLVAEQVGGVFQINILKAALGDLSKESSVYNRALQVASGATDEAFRKNDALNKTLASSFNDLRQSVTQLFAEFGKISLNPIVKSILDSLSGMAKFLAGSKIGEEAGKSIGENILQGIGNVLTGPGVVLLAAITQSVLKTLVAKVGTEFAEAFSASILRSGAITGIGQAGKITQTRKVIPRAADGLLPSIAGESAAINAGVGGATPSAKPVVIPNFNFGGGKKGPVVANTSEYIVPNYKGGTGSAIFNQNMISAYGLPSNAQKLAGGFIPNFASIKSRKASDGSLGSIRELSTDSGSYLKYFFDEDSKKIDIDYLKSLKKGEAFQLFNSLGKRAKRLGVPVYSGVLEPQKRQITRDATNYENLIEIFPQLRYRDQKGLKNSGLLGINTTSSIPSYDEKTFRSISGLRSYINSFDRADFVKKLVNDKISLSDIETKFAKGYIPNFADQLFRGVGGKGGDEFLRQLLIGGSVRSSGKGGGQGGGAVYVSSDKSVAQDYAASYATRTLNTGARDKGYIFGISTNRAVNSNANKQHLSEKILPSLLSSEVSTLQRVKTISDSDGYSYQTKLGKPLDFKRFADKYRKLFLPQFANGFIPNFATSQADYFRNFFSSGGSALSDAIKRERKAGIPMSSIYIDKDKRVASRGNPLGLLVANRMDEPSGGYQGVNRALSLGLNPATHGDEDGYNLSHFYKAKGYIPNFADNVISPFAAALGGSISPEKLQGLSKTEIKKVQAAYYRFIYNLDSRMKDAGDELTTLALSLKDTGKGGKKSKAFDAIFATVQKGTKQLEELERVNYLAGENTPKEFTEQKSSPRGGVDPDFIINKQFDDESKRERLAGARLARQRALSKEKFIYEQVQRGDVVSDADIQFVQRRKEKQLQRSNPLYKGLTPKALQKTRDTNVAQLYSLDVEDALGGLKEQNAINADQRKARQIQERQERRRVRSERGLLGLSIVSSFAAPAIESGINTAIGGTAGKAIGGGVGGALQGAGIGAIFGPIGAGVGAAVGGLVGVFSKLTKSAEEFGEELNKATSEQTRSIDALQQYLQTRGELDEANRSGASDSVKNRLNERLNRQFSEIDPNISKNLSGKNTQEIIDIFGKESGKLENTVRINSQKSSVFSATKNEDPFNLKRIGIGALTLGASESAFGKIVRSGLSTKEADSELTGRQIGSDIQNANALKNIAGRKDLIGLIGNEKAGESKKNRDTLQQALKDIPAFEGVEVTADNFKELNIILNQAATTSNRLAVSLKEQTKVETERAAYFSKIKETIGAFRIETQSRQIERGGVLERRGLLDQTTLGVLQSSRTAEDFAKIKTSTETEQAKRQFGFQKDDLTGQTVQSLREILLNTALNSEDTQKIEKGGIADVLSIAGKSDQKEAKDILQKYGEQLEINNKAQKEAIKTIELRNTLELEADSIQRKRIAFLNAPTLGGDNILKGANDARALVARGQGDIRVNKIKETDANFETFERLRELGGGKLLSKEAQAQLEKTTVEKQKNGLRNLLVNALSSGFENPRALRTFSGAPVNDRILGQALQSQINSARDPNKKAQLLELQAQFNSQIPRKGGEEDLKKLTEIKSILDQQEKNISKLASTQISITNTIQGTIELVSNTLSEAQTEETKKLINEAVMSVLAKVNKNTDDKVASSKGEPNPPSKAYEKDGARYASKDEIAGFQKGFSVVK